MRARILGLALVAVGCKPNPAFDEVAATGSGSTAADGAAESSTGVWSGTVSSGSRPASSGGGPGTDSAGTAADTAGGVCSPGDDDELPGATDLGPVNPAQGFVSLGEDSVGGSDPIDWYAYQSPGGGEERLSFFGTNNPTLAVCVYVSCDGDRGSVMVCPVGKRPAVAPDGTDGCCDSGGSSAARIDCMGSVAVRASVANAEVLEVCQEYDSCAASIINVMGEPGCSS